jgi:pimeloyl-ACP methyl ester carboxylesterase
VSSKDYAAIEEGWTVVDGVRTRYLRAGSGPPLVLLHGLLGYSFSWRFTIPVLARQATIIAVDMPGAGFSERSAHLDCGFRGSAGRLLFFLSQIGVSSFDLLGTSHGGSVAMMAAAIARQSSAQQVRRLILVAPVNPWSNYGRRRILLLSRPSLAALFRHLAPAMTFAHSFLLRRLYGDPNRIPPGTLEGYSKPFACPNSVDYALRILSTWNGDLQDLEATIAQIADIPTLVIWGNRDVAVDPASAEILRSRFNDCRLVMLEGVGHLPYEESPEDFNRIVVDFLQSSPQQH